MAFPSSAFAQCTKDADCKGDRICEGGRCMVPPAGSSIAPSGTSSSVTPPAPPQAAPPAAPASAAAPPAPTRVPVRVEAGAGTQLTFMSSGQQSEVCIVTDAGNCSVNLVPGPISVQVNHDGRSFQQVVQVSPAPTTLRVSEKGGVGGAVLFTVVGGLSLGIGLALWGGNNFSTTTCTICDGTDNSTSGAATAGLIMTIEGAIFLPIGLIGFASRGHDSVTATASTQALVAGPRFGLMRVHNGAVGALGFAF